MQLINHSATEIYFIRPNIQRLSAKPISSLFALNLNYITYIFIIILIQQYQLYLETFVFVLNLKPNYIHRKGYLVTYKFIIHSTKPTILQMFTACWF